MHLCRAAFYDTLVSLRLATRGKRNALLLRGELQLACQLAHRRVLRVDEGPQFRPLADRHLLAGVFEELARRWTLRGLLERLLELRHPRGWRALGGKKRAPQDG